VECDGWPPLWFSRGLLRRLQSVATLGAPSHRGEWVLRSRVKAHGQNKADRGYQLQKPIASSGGFISPPGGITYPDLSGKLAA